MCWWTACWSAAYECSASASELHSPRPPGRPIARCFDLKLRYSEAFAVTRFCRAFCPPPPPPAPAPPCSGSPLPRLPAQIGGEVRCAHTCQRPRDGGGRLAAARH
jgi:hypothetical protein